MEIRQMMHSDDIYSIAKIYVESWKFAYEGIIPQDYLDRLMPDIWVENLKKSERHSLIAIERGRYIGVASYSKSRMKEFADWGEIISIYLFPEYIGKGCGKKLLTAALTELKKLGYYHVFLWVLEDNVRARAFYENMGFAYSGKFLDDNIGGKKLREIQYCYHCPNP